MKTFLLLVLTVAALFVWQRKSHPDATGRQAPPAAPAVEGAPRPTAEHDWARNSLDRVREATERVRESRQEEQPR